MRKKRKKHKAQNPPKQKKTHIVLKEHRFVLDNSFKSLTSRKYKNLIIPLTNLMFHTQYAMNEQITMLNKEHHAHIDSKHARRFSDAHYSINGTRFLLECLAYSDGSIVLRMTEYAFMEALEYGEQTSPWEAEYRLPRIGLLLIRGGKNVPEQGIIHIEDDEFSVINHMEIVQMRFYSVDEIIEQKLYFLMPFTCFLYPEKKERTAEEIQQMAKDLSAMLDALEQAALNGELTTQEAKAVLQCMWEVYSRYTSGDHKTRKEVQNTMRGKEIYVPGTKQYDEGIKVGREEGREEGVLSTLQSLVDDGSISYEKAAQTAGISVEAFKKQVAELK